MKVKCRRNSLKDDLKKEIQVCGGLITNLAAASYYLPQAVFLQATLKKLSLYIKQNLLIKSVIKTVLKSLEYFLNECHWY